MKSFMKIILPKVTSLVLVFIMVFALVGCKDTIPTEIKINNENINFEIGQEVIIDYEVLPSDAKDKRVEFKSSDETIARVDETGKVSFLKDGYVTITITSQKDKNITNDISFKVESADKDVMPTDIEISSEKQEVEIGDELTLIAIVKPDNTTNKEVSWESSDATIATVENGVVKGLKKGTVTIKVISLADKKVYKEIEINVIKAVYNPQQLITNTINEYLKADKASVMITSINDKETLIQKFAYSLENKQLVKFINQLSGSTESALYIKDGIMYQNANGVKQQYEASESEISEIYESTNITTVLENVTSFYLEDAFYNALEMSETSSELTKEFILNIRDYEGNKFDTFNKDEVMITVTLTLDGKLEKILCTSISDKTTVKLEIAFLGLDFVIDYPSDLNNYE